MSELNVIIKRSWKTLLTFNALMLAIAATGLVTMPKTWTATSKFILPQSKSVLDANLGELGSFKDSPGPTDDKSKIPTQISILTSDTLMQKLFEADPEKNKLKSHSKYAKLFSVETEEDSIIFNVAVEGSSSELALRRLTNLTKAYQQRLHELRREDKKSRTQFSQEDLLSAKLRLDQSQKALAQYKEVSGLVSSEEQAKGMVTMLNSLITSKVDAQTKAEVNAARAKTLAFQQGITVEQALKTLNLSENQNFLAVRNQLIELEAALVAYRSMYNDNHPQIQILLSQFNELRGRYKQYVAQAAAHVTVDPTITSGSGSRAALMLKLIDAENEATAGRKQTETLNQQIEALQKTLQLLPQKQARLEQLQRQYDLAEGIYKGLVAQSQQANLDVFSAYPNVQVLDQPVVKPSRSPLLLVGLSALLAAASGSVAIVLFSERRSPSLMPRDLQLTKVSVLASIPHSKLAPGKPRFTSESEVAFQQLASLITMQHFEKGRLLVASAIAGEGKTTAVIGLAESLVDLGFQVLMVDADFRKAELSQRLGFFHSGDLVFQKPMEVAHNLDILPTSPQRGKILDLVARGRFEQYIANAEATRSYDYILIDSAPVSLTSETVLMATITDGVIFAVRPSVSKRDSVHYGLEKLNQHKVNILGWVVNDVTPSKAYLNYGADVPATVS
jgi:polysaccharide biosynthesis transport protein